MLGTFIITISWCLVKFIRSLNYFFYYFIPFFLILRPNIPKIKKYKKCPRQQFYTTRQDGSKFECFNSGYCVSFKLEYYLVKSDSTGNGIPIPYISVSLTIALRLLHNCFNIPLFI